MVGRLLDALLPMARLPRIADLDATAVGAGFFLCARKERRPGRSGPYLTLILQDVSGEISAKVFQDVEQAEDQFEAGEFVAVQGRGNLFHERVELILDKIRRVIPDDATRGFRQEDCIPASPRSVEEMWQELGDRVASVEHAQLRVLLARMIERHADRLRIWPAAVHVHHAYRSGLLEHVLMIMELVTFLAARYGARRDLLIAGALLHDIGKLQELDYDVAIAYSVEGNLVGHIALGVGMLREELAGMPDFPHDLQTELEHLILSHHGAKELGSPVVPMTVEAFILAAADDLDAKLHQVRRLIAEDDSDGPFTIYSKRLERQLFKPESS
jgi:3'-5' exoribonuclease